jgi:23S rRNA pseudouridine1911/1915/1917 synthase
VDSERRTVDSARSTMNDDLKNRILFEDNHLFVVNKLPSEIVQGDITGDVPLLDVCKAYIKDVYDKPGNVFLGLVHRIDRPTSGALIFAKTSKALSRLNEQIRNKQISKTYWAIVKQKPQSDAGHLLHYLIKNEQKNKSAAYDEDRKGCKKAELKYQLLQTFKGFHLLEVDLITGRHHQIRAQLSKIGCPIKGDLKYGFDKPNDDKSISLHARYLRFKHPVTKEDITIAADPKPDPLWDFFLKNAPA